MGATHGRQDIKLVGRTVEETRGDGGEKLVRERSTERILAADNRRIGKDEDIKVSDVHNDQ